LNHDYRPDLAISARTNANADLLRQWIPIEQLEFRLMGSWLTVRDKEAISSRASAGRVVTRVVGHAVQALEADLRRFPDRFIAAEQP